MSFSRPLLDDLIERSQADINARLAGADAFLRRSVLSVLAKVNAAAAHGVYGNLAWLARQLFVDTSDEDLLLRQADFWGQARLAAQYAVGPVVCTGINGSEVTVGAELQTAAGVAYAVTVGGIVAAGTVTVTVQAVVAGEAGNADAGAGLTFTSPLVGVDAAAVVDTGGLVGGADQESPEDLRARTLQRVRTPPRGGHVEDYVAWCLELALVSRAWSFAGWTGIGTVGVTFMASAPAGAETIPSAGELATVEAYLLGHTDPLTGRTVGKPATAELVVFAPTPVVQLYTIALTPDNSDVRAAVEAELDDLHYRDATPGATLYLSRVREAVSSATGETDSTVTVPAADVVPNPGEMLTRGAVTWV